MDKAKYWHQIELPQSEKVTIIEDDTIDNADYRDYKKELEQILAEKYPDFDVIETLNRLFRGTNSIAFLKLYVFAITLLDIDLINYNEISNVYCDIRFESIHSDYCSCFIRFDSHNYTSIAINLYRVRGIEVKIYIQDRFGNASVIKNILDIDNIHKNTIILQDLYKFFARNPNANINYLNYAYLKHICPELGRIKQPPRPIKRM